VMDKSAVASIEQIEREAWLDLFSVAPADIANLWGAWTARLPAATVFALRGAPLVEFNRALGIGVERPATEEGLDHVTAWLRTHANPAWALQIAPVDRSDALLRWMEHRGLTADSSGVAKFLRRRSEIADQSLHTTFKIKAVEPQDAALFGLVVQAGFEAPPAFAPWFAGLVGRPKWRIYLAYDGKDPIASGAMFIDRGWAWMGIDATLPAYRRQGAQVALLSRRISDGLAAGVEGYTAETDRPIVEHEAAQSSYRNYLRAGFRVAYTRDNYRPA
jgi:ribosomal protein S18 acetylase RimI-like enzyme